MVVAAEQEKIKDAEDVRQQERLAKAGIND